MPLLIYGPSAPVCYNFVETHINSWDSCIFRKLQLAISAYMARWPCCATPKAQEILSLESRCQRAHCTIWESFVRRPGRGGSKSLPKDDTETSLFAVVKKSFHACALFIEGVRVGERSSGITSNHFDMYPSAKLQVAMKAAAKATKQQFWLQIGNMESHCHFICKFCKFQCMDFAKHHGQLNMSRCCSLRRQDKVVRTDN